MPEFPEVYTITKDLDKILSGAQIKNIAFAPDYEAMPNNKAFKKAEGTKVTSVDQVAKNIILSLERDLFINIHLAMSGQVLIKKKNQKLKWERATITLQKGPKEFYLAYRSIRMFGKIRLLEKKDYLELKGKYGPHPLSEELTFTRFKEIVRSKRTNIKNLLMEQDKVGGLGNIYATEALFLARINPETRTHDLSDNEIKQLLEAVHEIIQEGIKNRGATLEDELYVDVYGKKGQQQKFFRIYNQKNCPVCGDKIQKVKISGRNTCFCPSCQSRKSPEDPKLL